MVLFGSQTGTAEDFGEQIVSEMEAYGIVGDLKDMEDVDGDELMEQSLVLFVVATYGEGEPTDNAKDLWEWVSKECTEDLKALKFGVFGLGNKTYEHYNWMGRKLNERLVELGAAEVIKYGEGDDDATLEDDFSEWKKSLWAPLCEQLGVKQDVSLFETGSLTRSWKWEVVFAGEAKAAAPASGVVRERFSGKVDPKKRVYDQHHPFYTEIENYRELNAEGCERGCLHADIRLPKGVRYEEGDHLALYPVNASALVSAYCDYFGYDPTLDLLVFGNTDKDRGKILFGPAPLAHALATLVDLQDVPRKSVLERFASYCSENPEQEKALRQYLEKQTYIDQVEKRYMTVLEILQSLPGPRLVVPPEQFLQIVAPLQPRYYSISSSMRWLAPSLLTSITCARVDYKSPTGREHPGVASHWLYNLQKKNPDYSGRVAAFVRSSTFRMPSSGRPAIMIGPGTGLAPFMGFIQRRAADKRARGEQKNGAEKKSEDMLFTGFRNKQEYLYGEQLEQWAQEGLVELHVAFSREGPEKHYVQHDIEKNQDRVWELIDSRKGNVYICGDANHMEKDVVATLLRIFAAKKGGSEQAAQAYLEKMVSTKQLQKDTWF
jgi:NADPH-ferrihemoprotein reductase